MRRNCTFLLFSYQKEIELKGRDLQASTSCVDAVGGYQRLRQKKGKGRTGGSIEDETIAWILQCQANDEKSLYG